MSKLLAIKTHQTFLIALAAIVVLAILTKWQTSPIQPLSSEASKEVFSAGRAFQLIEHLTNEQVPHVVDMPANRVVEDRIIQYLESLGYQPSIQQADVCRARSGSGRCTQVRNIIVKVQGSSPSKGILLSAHYDSVPAGPGVSDAITAVGTLLETARLLSQSDQPKNTIVFLFNEGEEYGLMGAKAFMDEHPLAKEVQIALNIEARGTTGKSVMFETGEDSGWLVDIYANTTPSALTSSLFYEAYKVLPNDTDLTIFKQGNLQGLNFAHAENLPHYHTPLDNLEQLNLGSLQHHGDNIWGVLKTIKDLDLNNTNAGNLVYTDILSLFVISWSESINLTLTLIIIGLFIVIRMLTIRQFNITRGSIFISLLVILISVVAGTAISFGLQNLVQMLSGNSTPWLSNELPMRFALWLGILAVIIYIGRYGLAKRTPIEVLAALGNFWVILSIVSAIAVPGITFLFLIPLVITTAGIAFIYVNKTSESLDALIEKTVIVIALASAVTFVAVAFVLEIMVTFRMSIAVGIMLSFCLANLLPALANQQENSKTNSIHPIGLTSLSLLVVCILWTSFQSPYSAANPQHLNIVYVQHQDGQSFINTGNQNSKIPQSLREALNKEIGIEKIYPWSEYKRPSVIVENNQQLNPAEISVTTDDSNSTEKRLKIKADFPGFMEISLYIPKSFDLKKITKGNKTVSYRRTTSYYPDYYEFRCRGKSCANQELVLEVGNNSDEKIFVMTTYDHLPIEFKNLKQARGDLAVPVHDGDKSQVISWFNFGK